MSGYADFICTRHSSTIPNQHLLIYIPLTIPYPQIWPFQDKYSSHILHIFPISERRHGAIEQRKKKREEIKSSIVSKSPKPKGESVQNKEFAQGHILPKAQDVVCSSHSIVIVPFSPPSLIILSSMTGM